MAITQIDGFDLYTSINGSNLTGLPVNSRWTVGNGALIAGRFGGQAVQLTAGAMSRAVEVPTATIALGMAFKVNDVTSAGAEILSFLDNTGTRMITISTNAVGGLNVYLGGNVSTLLGATPPGLLALNTYHYLEIELVISNTVGVVNLYLDGAPELTLSGIDTQVGTPSVISLVRISGSSTVSACDDYYLTDTAVKLGEQKVTTNRASADTAAAQWTPLTGTSGAAMVSDSVVDGDTTYISSATVGQKSIFDMANFSAPVPLAITAVQISFTARKDDATTRQVRSTNISGATPFVGTTQNMTSSYLKFNAIYATDPNTTAAWTPAAVDALEAGVEVVT